jgi:hypothetical protein
MEIKVHTVGKKNQVDKLEDQNGYQFHVIENIEATKAKK